MRAVIRYLRAVTQGAEVIVGGCTQAMRRGAHEGIHAPFRPCLDDRHRPYLLAHRTAALGGLTCS